MANANLRDPRQWIPRDLFAAYCGPHSDKLLAYYDKAVRRRQIICWDFDWLPFFAVLAWLPYRRQWASWAILTGLLAASAVVEYMAQIELPSSAFAAGLAAMGLLAHSTLLTDANGRYLKLKRQGLSADALLAALRDRARPNQAWAWLGIMGALAINTLVVFLLQGS